MRRPAGGHVLALVIGSDHQDVEPLGVLVVEPRDSLAVRLKERLERLGHRVLGMARDGREAVEAALRLRPGLVLLDSRLPRVDGIDVARAIVSAEPVPIVLLTDYAGAELVRRAKDAGVVAYLTSTDQRQLKSAIDAALERFREFRIIRNESSTVSDALAARKLVDNAKRRVATRLKLSESEAFRHILGHTARTRRRVHETARTLIRAEEALTHPNVARALLLIFRAIGEDLSPRRGSPGARPPV